MVHFLRMLWWESLLRIIITFKEAESTEMISAPRTELLPLLKKVPTRKSSHLEKCSHSEYLCFSAVSYVFFVLDIKEGFTL